MRLLILIFLLFASCQKKNIFPKNITSPQYSQIVYGRDLVLHTSMYFGPRGSLSVSNNGMNCTNCHLEAGTVEYGNNFKAVFGKYPSFRERSGTFETLEQRINDCFERSLNGNPLNSESNELKAMVVYINSVGKEIPKNSIRRGTSTRKLKFLKRAARPDFGKIIYKKNCVQCHGINGEGKLENEKSADFFKYPPLWGNKSYNVSAGLYRIQNLAGFIYTNMPKGLSTSQTPFLTEEQSWDVAAYIISQPRPVKFFKKDWPDIKTKPIDYAFGPYSDPFTEEQHKFGPFEPIINYRKR